MAKPKSPLQKPFTQNETIFPEEVRPGHRNGPIVARRGDIFRNPLTPGADDLIHVITGKKMTPDEHEHCVSEARAAWKERNGAACEDCAFRLGSPEAKSGAVYGIEEQAEGFRCHQGMPLRVIRQDNGKGLKKQAEFVPHDFKAYPVCNGWAYFRSLDAQAEGLEG